METQVETFNEQYNKAKQSLLQFWQSMQHEKLCMLLGEEMVIVTLTQVKEIVFPPGILRPWEQQINSKL